MVAGIIASLYPSEAESSSSSADTMSSLDMRRFTDTEVNRVTRMYQDRWLQMLVVDRKLSSRTSSCNSDSNSSSDSHSLPDETSRQQQQQQTEFSLPAPNEQAEFDYLVRFFWNELANSPSDEEAAVLEIYDRLNVVNRVLADRLLANEL